MMPSDMDLHIGKIFNFTYKILISRYDFLNKFNAAGRPEADRPNKPVV